MSGLESAPRPLPDQEARTARPLCVQVVESDRAARSLLSHWLRSAGFTVVEGESEMPCDVACVEWSLAPGGTLALGALRSRHPALPILALSTPADAETALEAIR